MGAEQKALQHRRGNPCVLRNSSGLLLGTRGLGCAVPPAHVRDGPGSSARGMQEGCLQALATGGTCQEQLKVSCLAL